MKADSGSGGRQNEQHFTEWEKRNAAIEQRLIYKTLLLGLACVYLWLMMSFMK